MYVQAAKGIRKLLFALIVSLPAVFNIGALLGLSLTREEGLGQARRAACRTCRFPLHALRLKLGARIVNRRERMADLACRLRAVVRNEAAAAEEVIRVARHGHDQTMACMGTSLHAIFLPLSLSPPIRPVCD